MTFSSEVASEIDRLVIGGHDAARVHPDRPPVLATLAAQPGVLNTVAIVLLHRPLTRAEIGLTMRYTPPTIVQALIDDNVTSGVLVEQPDGLALTPEGRGWADGIVALHELAIEAVWAEAVDALDAVLPILVGVVETAPRLEPPPASTAFSLFAGVVDRPSVPSSVLRLATALRYWRSDAHRRALDDAGLSPRAAHALNVLWDEHRAVTRVGQGSPDLSAKGTADLEASGLVAGGRITPAGLELRVAVEDATDRHTDPLYRDLDDARRVALLAGLAALPS